MFGEGEYEAQCRALGQSLNLTQLQFLGFCHDVPGLLTQTDVLVHASTSPEPFGQVVVQAMAAGKPVVATNAGGVKEIVLPGQTGLLVDMGDVEQMAQAVCTLLASPAEAGRMGECGRQRVLQKFTIGHTITTIMGVYDSMMNGPATWPARFVAPAAR